MKVKTIFKGKNIYYRDSDIDSWLKDEYPKQKIENVSSFDTKLSQTFLDMSKDFAHTDNPIQYVFTPAQIEEMLESPSKYNLLENGYANFFFVEGKEGVCVVGAYRYDGQWHVRMYRLGDVNVWFAGRRVFLRNLTLGSSDTLSLERAIELVKKEGYKIFKEI